MDAVGVAVIWWAATDSPSPWSTLSILAGVVATLAAAFVGVGAYRTNKAAAAGQREIEGVRTSLAALESALARSDIERVRGDADRERLSAELATTRADLAEALVRIDQLSRDFTTERRHHAEQVKVLIRQIRRLGAEPEGDHDDR